MYFRPVRKNLLIWLLISTFGYASFGDYIRWHLEWKNVRQHIKHQLKSGVKPEKLHRFVLSKSEYNNLDWIKEKKEFKLGSDLYDVVNYNDLGDNILLLCIHDKEEAVLFKNLDALISNHFAHEQQEPSSNTKVKYMKKDWHSEELTISIPTLRISAYPPSVDRKQMNADLSRETLPPETKIA
jgi:hypothetical protein